jgi:integral membrane protein
MSELQKFRFINKVEGYSFLILLFIAMPLKYMAGIPMATKIVGMIHGLLFILFIYQLIEATSKTPFTKKEAFIFFIASILPFGSFYTEKICSQKA